jgi:hypothetical protein
MVKEMNKETLKNKKNAVIAVLAITSLLVVIGVALVSARDEYQIKDSPLFTLRTATAIDKKIEVISTYLDQNPEIKNTLKAHYSDEEIDKIIAYVAQLSADGVSDAELLDAVNKEIAVINGENGGDGIDMAIPGGGDALATFWGTCGSTRCDRPTCTNTCPLTCKQCTLGSGHTCEGHVSCDCSTCDTTCDNCPESSCGVTHQHDSDPACHVQAEE